MDWLGLELYLDCLEHLCFSLRSHWATSIVIEGRVGFVHCLFDVGRGAWVRG